MPCLKFVRIKSRHVRFMTLCKRRSCSSEKTKTRQWCDNISAHVPKSKILKCICTLQDWNVCAKMSNPLGQSGLQKRLMRFDFRLCNAEMVSRAKQILDRIQLEDIVKKSRGGACFFVYVSPIHMTSPCLLMYDVYVKMHVNVCYRQPESSKTLNRIHR